MDGIAGNAPSPINWPSGCRFHPRCPHAMPVCSARMPALLPLHGDHGPLVACHLYTHAPAEATA
jgi:oligopeptide/dipeptide ABC transporter ATP-binding protein